VVVALLALVVGLIFAASAGSDSAEHDHSARAAGVTLTAS
jgi:hypothetical protein